MTLQDYRPISCSDHDHLEIACMDGYRVRLTTTSDLLSGIAADLKVANHEEFLVLRLDDGRSENVRIDRIRFLEVLSEPRRFSEHRFGPEVDSRDA